MSTPRRGTDNLIQPEAREDVVTNEEAAQSQARDERQKEERKEVTGAERALKLAA